MIPMVGLLKGPTLFGMAMTEEGALVRIEFGTSAKVVVATHMEVWMGPPCGW